MKTLKIYFPILILLSFCLFFFSFSFAATSTCETYSYKQVKGYGPLPYNYRIIDKNVHAGGHPLRPPYFKNTDQQVMNILSYLKKSGIDTILDLENSSWIQKRYAKLLKKAGIKRIHIPMHASKVPTKKEWAQIKEAMKKPIYIHCKWGADRTGAIIGRYLVDIKGYTPYNAYNAVISGGSHAGPLGGLKTTKDYYNMKKFIYSK